MKMELTQPCSNCPFRTDVKGYLTKSRVRELRFGLVQQQSSFSCHKTNKFTDDGETIEDSNSQHCAGAMILLEKLNKPNQLMRISERLGGYDMRKLKMDSPVFDNFEQMIKSQER
jgi:hypothetical protein